MANRTEFRVARSVGISAACVYLAACATPALERRSKPIHDFARYRSEWGITALLLGGFSARDGYEKYQAGDRSALSNLAWLANPVGAIALGLFVFRRPVIAATWSAAAFALALWYLLDPPTEYGWVDHPRIGSYLWAGSFCVLAVGAVLARACGWKRIPPTDRAA